MMFADYSNIPSIKTDEISQKYKFADYLTSIKYITTNRNSQNSQMLPENIERALKSFRQQKQKPNYDHLSDFMLKRLKNMTKPETQRIQFLQNRKYQSESLMKNSKRRQLYQTTRIENRRLNIHNQRLAIMSSNASRTQSLTIKDPIHSRKNANFQCFHSQTLRKKKQTTISSPFQHLLNITQAVEDHMSTSNTFSIRRQRTPMKRRRPYFKPTPEKHIKATEYGCRPWSPDTPTFTLQAEQDMSAEF